MNSMIVLAVLAVASVNAMPQAATVETPAPAVQQEQTNTFPTGFFFNPQGGISSPLIQVQRPFFAQIPGVAGQAGSLQHVFPITSYVMRPLSEAEQNALAYQEFQRIWEAQATRNLAIPQLQAVVDAKQAKAAAAAAASAPVDVQPEAQPLAAEPFAAPLESTIF